jgi:hypothetical protein
MTAPPLPRRAAPLAAVLLGGLAAVAWSAVSAPVGIEPVPERPIDRPRAMAARAAVQRPVPAPTVDTVELLVDDAPPGRLRTVTVDLRPFDGRDDQLRVTYDVDGATRPTSLARIATLPDWVAGVRLLLGEVGVGRLRASRWSVLEGVGILETVRNRLDPLLANPLDVRGVRAWPGCGPGGTFPSCIDPGQYLGIATSQALRPRTAAPDEATLLEATDRAVTAWVVFELGVLTDVTAGATSFVHLCGGPSYGHPTAACDGAGVDEPGAEAHTGPIVFRGPSAWSKRDGRYLLSVLGKVDYERGAPPADPKAYVGYLLGSDAAAYVEAAAASPSW